MVDSEPSAPSLRELLDREYDWSPRQRQVLNLLVRGCSNQEISDELGISLDGAKWHLREIFAKLGVDSREEAAEYWRAQNGLRLRFTRLTRSFVPASAWVRAAIALAGVSGVAFIVAALLIALHDSGGNNAASGAGPTSTATTASPSATTNASLTPTPTVSPTTASGPLSPIGIFDDPRPTTPVRTIQPPAAPPASFAPWDGVSTVLYDVVAMRATDLGPGSVASFSPDSAHMVWVAVPAGASPGGDGDVRVMNLLNGAITSLGPGSTAYPRFLDDSTVGFGEAGAGNTAVTVNIATGARTNILPIALTDRYFARPDIARSLTPDGFRIEVSPGDATAPLARNVRVIDKGGVEVLALTALAAVPAGSGHVAIETTPKAGSTNVFLIDIATRQAQLLGSARLTSDNSPFVADDHRVMWFDNFCGDPRGKAFMYVRATGDLVAVALDNFFTLTPGGLVAVGSFGAKALLDPATFATTVTLPAGSDVTWSPTYHYAVHGQTGGHGGLC